MCIKLVNYSDKNKNEGFLLNIVTSHAETCTQIVGWIVSYVTAPCLAQLFSVICSNHSGREWEWNLQMINLYKILIWKSEGVKSLGRFKSRWDYTMKMSLGDRNWGGGLDSSGSREAVVTGSYEQGKDTYSATKKECLDKLLYYQLQKMNSAVWSWLKMVGLGWNGICPF